MYRTLTIRIPPEQEDTPMTVLRGERVLVRPATPSDA
jgi:hypothetical protein